MHTYCSRGGKWSRGGSLPYPATVEGLVVELQDLQPLLCQVHPVHLVRQQLPCLCPTGQVRSHLHFAVAPPLLAPRCHY